jgi:tetratricopeptide (TPR) repeat protein
MMRGLSLLLLIGVMATAIGAAPVPGYFLEIESYDLEVRLLPPEDRVEVEATLRIANHTFWPLEVLDLYLPFRAEVVSCEIDGDVAKVDETPLRADELRQLTFHPRPPIPIDESFSVKIRYAQTFLERSGAAQIEPGASHLTIDAKWVPFLHQFGSSYGVDYAPTHMRVTVPADETVVMQGRVEEIARTADTVTYDCATSLSAMPLLISGRYRTLEVDREGKRAVGYLFDDMDPAADTAMRTLLERGLEILDFYTSLYGPLPGDEPLRIVAADLKGGRGYPRCLVVARDTFDFEGEPDRDKLEFLAHEIAHTWFPGLLRPRARAAGLPTEGLATYSAAVAVEHFMGEAEATRIWEKNQREVSEYPRAPHPLIDEGSTTALTYHKGAYWWRTLEWKLGRGRLTGLIRSFAQENALHAIPFDEQFQWIDEQTPDVDLRPLFDWYLRGTELANVGVESAPRTRARDGGVTAEVEILQSGFAGLPVDLEIRVEGGERIRHSVALTDAPSQRVSIDLSGEPLEVSLDPDRWLLQSRYGDDHWPRERDAMGYLRMAASAWRLGRSEEGLEPIAEALARQPENPRIHFTAGLLLLDTDDPSGALEHLLRARELYEEQEEADSEGSVSTPVGMSTGQAWMLVALGRAYHAMGMIDDARASWYQVPATDATRRAQLEAQLLMGMLDREMENSSGD